MYSLTERIAYATVSNYAYTLCFDFPLGSETFLSSTTVEERSDGFALLRIHRNINIVVDNIITRFEKKKKSKKSEHALTVIN